ncbi:MAG: hypothetical protein GWP10_21710 [Nitrospiraceae bacterium]|nr:hypothetical protein [Nitrospiraceae bacterium]
MTKKNLLVVIPARGGSKGIKRKNLRILNGKPLIYYQIQNALNSKFIPDIVVTSDDDEILEYASNFDRVSIRKRPKKLAGDNITLDPVIYDAVSYIESQTGKRYEGVVTLQPTSPLLRSDTLDKAIKKLIDGKYDTIIPVVDATHLYWKEEKGRIVPDYKKRLNRQWLPKKYKEAGAFLITRREFVTPTSRFGERIDIFLVDEMEGIDIDTPLDWIVAETMMKRLRILFIVNGNETIGMGHIYRALTLSEHLLGHEIIFLTYDSNRKAITLLNSSEYPAIITSKEQMYNEIKKAHPDIVINDILDTTIEHVERLKEVGAFVINFEDLGSGAEKAHLTFNALYEKTNPPSNHRFGYLYECLNERFYLYPPVPFREPPKTLFISFGGIDQNNLTARVLKVSYNILTETPIERIIIVLGPAYSQKEKIREMINSSPELRESVEVYTNVENMPRLMREADIAITSNGRTIYELTAMGVPTISIAQNDRETLHLFARYHSGIRYLGIACTVGREDIFRAIKEISTDSNLRKEMYLAQREAGRVIRRGTQRVIEEILLSYWRWKDEKNSNWAV